MTLTISFNAFDRRSSDSFSHTVTVNSPEELKKEWELFENSVPFDKWYSDNEYNDENLTDDWLDVLDECE